MKHSLFFAALASLAVAVIAVAAPGKTAEPEYVDAINQWRDSVEKSLRRDNGWLTLAGRYVMKSGEMLAGARPDIVWWFHPAGIIAPGASRR